jgi:hypothetical protein
VRQKIVKAHKDQVAIDDLQEYAAYRLASLSKWLSLLIVVFM